MLNRKANLKDKHKAILEESKRTFVTKVKEIITKKKKK